MAIAQLYVTEKIGERARFLLWPGLLLIGAALVGFEQCRMHHWDAVWMAPLNNVLDAGLCCVLAASLSGRGWVVRMLSVAWLQVTGVMCYSLYLWHQPLADWVEAGAADMARPARLVIWVVLSFAVGALSYRFIEFGKTRNWRALFLLRGPVVAAAAASDPARPA
jgi:peptidoglycan/LPS O-acetylase OafA/YrhL